MFLSPIIFRKAGLEQSRLTVVEKHGEIQESWNKLWQGLSLLSMVSAALGFILVPLEKSEGRDGHQPLLFGDVCCSFLAVMTLAAFSFQAECNRAGFLLICCSSDFCSHANSWKQWICLAALTPSKHRNVI